MTASPSILFYTCVNEKFWAFGLLYPIFVLNSNPGAKVEVGVENHLRFTHKFKHIISFYEKEYPGRVRFSAVSFTQKRLFDSRKIVEQHLDNIFVKAVFDVRTLLEGAQHFAADWTNSKMKEDLLNSMQFSHEEATDETPVSACGITLGVATTVRIISAIAVNNFINFLKDKTLKKLIIVDVFNFSIDAF